MAKPDGTVEVVRLGGKLVPMELKDLVPDASGRTTFLKTDGTKVAIDPMTLIRGADGKLQIAGAHTKNIWAAIEAMPPSEEAD